jgi:hypothetical protein
MEKIRIYKTQNMDGYIFGLDLATRKSIKKEFENAHPIGSLSIRPDTMSDFEDVRGDIEENIYTFILGIKESDLKKIGEVEFYDMQKNEVYKTVKI